MFMHTLQRPLKLPQVQCILKVQQSTKVLQQQYMNVDVPAEMQCQNTATHRHCRKLVKHNRLPSSSEAAVQSPGPVLQISSRRQTSFEMRE